MDAKDIRARDGTTISYTIRIRAERMVIPFTATVRLI